MRNATTEEILPGTTLPFILSRKTMRRTILRVRRDDGTLRVSAPHHAPIAQIHAFIRQHLDWISAEQARHSTASPVSPDFSRLWLWGSLIPVHWHAAGKHARAILMDDALACTLPETVNHDTARQAVLDRFLRQTLTNAIAQRLPHWCAITGHPLPTVGIRRMTSRWGSCQILRRRLSINLTLAHYPIGCLDLVLVHELTHFDERHHNLRFYQHMDAYFPEWRHWERVLKASPGALASPNSTFVGLGQ